MSISLAVLDYSVYGNTIDLESDRLLAEAATAAGVPAAVQPITMEREVRTDAERVWLRYDLRSRRDLSWTVKVAYELRGRGHRVFPSPVSILLAGDKWETWHAFRAAGIPTPATCLVLDAESVAFPAMLKPRVSWGGMENRVLRQASDVRACEAAEDTICQPFIPHDRMWIVPVAGGRELPAIEERREPERDGEARLFPRPDAAEGLAVAAARALHLPAATVDLIEGPDGPLVLEVNSSPRIPHTEVPGVDLATPMVRAVLEWMDA